MSFIIFGYDVCMSTRPTSFTAIIENLEKIDAIAARTKRSRSYVINEAMEKLIEQDQEQKEPPTKKKAGAR